MQAINRKSLITDRFQANTLIMLLMLHSCFRTKDSATSDFQNRSPKNFEIKNYENHEILFSLDLPNGSIDDISWNPLSNSYFDKIKIVSTNSKQDSSTIKLKLTGKKAGNFDVNFFLNSELFSIVHFEIEKKPKTVKSSKKIENVKIIFNKLNFQTHTFKDHLINNRYYYPFSISTNEKIVLKIQDIKKLDMSPFKIIENYKLSKALPGDKINLTLVVEPYEKGNQTYEIPIVFIIDEKEEREINLNWTLQTICKQRTYIGYEEGLEKISCWPKGINPDDYCQSLQFVKYKSPEKNYYPLENKKMYMNEKESRKYIIKKVEGKWYSNNSILNGTSGKYVMKQNGCIYYKALAPREDIHFKHTYLSGGEPVVSAGVLDFDDNGNIDCSKNHSGHYHPSVNHIEIVADWFRAHNVDCK